MSGSTISFVLNYFTATLLPAIFFHDIHDTLRGVRSFVELVEKEATTECNRYGDRGSKGTTGYDFKDVEVITEFHIARDIKFAGLPLAANVAWTAEPPPAEPKPAHATLVTIHAGHALDIAIASFRRKIAAMSSRGWLRPSPRRRGPTQNGSAW